MLAWYHGKPGRDEWTITEKIGIPLNFFFSAMLLLMVFSGKELGSATTSVSVKNELGQTVRRNIPKSEFGKRLAIFFFDNKSEQPELDWLQYGLMAGCYIDLNQDPFFSVYSAYDNLIYQKILHAGFGEDISMPMALEKKIAKEIQREYFLGGSFTMSQDTFIVSTYLYETIHGKLISEHEFRDKNVFTLIDQITMTLKRDLQIPDWHIQSCPDLPVREILTRSVSAYKYYIDGSNYVNLKNDCPQSARCFENAVKTDPTFAAAYWALYGSAIKNNQPEIANRAIESAMKYIYKLPENLHYAIKEEYYLITENPNKRAAVLNMWVQLYPRDVRAHFRLAGNYLKMNRLDKVIEEYKTILKIDHARRYYLRYLGNVYLQKGEFKQALKYYKQYQKEFPENYQSFMDFGELYYTMGDYQKATEYFINAQVIEPADIFIPIRLGDIDARKGNFSAAFEKYGEALKASKTPFERSDALAAFQKLYEMTGQIRKAIESRNRKFAEQAKYLNPIDAALNQLSDGSLKLYIRIGDKSTALAALNDYRSRLSMPWLRALSLGYLEVALKTQDIAAAEKAVGEVEELIRVFGEDAKNVIVHDARAKICEMRGNYIDALLEYQAKLQYVPTDVAVMTDIARCYREIGDYSKANSYLESTLRILPNSPNALYEMALVQIALDNPSKAAEHLKVLLKIWKNADADYAPAVQARQKLAELHAG
ncbi:MAG: hypothetical protein COT43_04140 [Candidatus Marinimicrobia bacterium CG08_land_8_20_14_0_20_45_22]|nr:MAG: hypothetical protein COT43_04140 [Candidatus Marinimicrobia bacterium CG08_land_8_20_14_0_20_45_22]